MNKLRLKSNLASPVNGADAAGKGIFPAQAGHGQAPGNRIGRKYAYRLCLRWLAMIGLSSNFLFIAAAGLELAAAAANPTNSFSGHPAKSTAATPARTQAPGYNMTVRVRNPRCPSCLKALKTYLSSQNGVSKVFVDSIGSSKPEVAIKIKLALPKEHARLIEHIRARDFEILSTSP
jgi:hypothetical protein